MAISATPHEHGTLLLFTNLFTYNDIYIFSTKLHTFPYNIERNSPFFAYKHQIHNKIIDLYYFLQNKTPPTSNILPQTAFQRIYIYI